MKKQILSFLACALFFNFLAAHGKEGNTWVFGYPPSQGRSESTIKNISEIQILPNPNNGRFQIQLPTAHTNTWNLEILDLNGRSCWQTNSTSNIAQIDAPLPSGFYFLRCTENGTGRKLVYRLIIQQ